MIATENASRLGHEKGAWAEDRARSELQRLGFSVDPPGEPCARGTDLVARRGSESFTVEVKLVIWNKRAWRVNRVTRVNDDMIALVFPSGAVHLDDMETHAILCARSGDRYLTLLGRFFEGMPE